MQGKLSRCRCSRQGRILQDFARSAVPASDKWAEGSEGIFASTLQCWSRNCSVCTQTKQKTSSKCPPASLVRHLLPGGSPPPCPKRSRAGEKEEIPIQEVSNDVAKEVPKPVEKPKPKEKQKAKLKEKAQAREKASDAEGTWRPLECKSGRSRLTTTTPSLWRILGFESCAASVSRKCRSKLGTKFQLPSLIGPRQCLKCNSVNQESSLCTHPRTSGEAFLKMTSQLNLRQALCSLTCTDLGQDRG